MFFSIRRQHDKLHAYAKEILTKKLEYHLPTRGEGVGLALENVKQSYAYYRLSTRSSFGRLLSFIPGTSVFSARRRCAKAIEEATCKLDEIAAKIAPLEAAKQSSRAVPRSQSAPLPYIFPSLFKAPKMSKDDLYHRVRFTSCLRMF